MHPLAIPTRIRATRPADMRLKVWKAGTLEQNDWDFSKCFDDEIVDCFCYEYARESQEAMATVGFPDIGLQEFAPKLAKREIASLAGAADDPRYFQISLPVQPGNSGGALVDAHGNVVGIVAAKLDASAALAATGSLPENVNYTVKSSLLLSFLESVPDVAAKLKKPNTKDESFEDMVKSAQEAAVLVLVY